METGKSFDHLVAEGASVPLGGWDFSLFQGRASEQRPSWGYSTLLVQRVGRAAAVLDIETGGGEVLGEVLGRVARPPRVVAATESWPPNLEIAARRLAPSGALVVQVGDDGPFPFRDGFDQPDPTTVSTAVARRSIEVKDLFSCRPLLTLVRGGERDLAGAR
jgi:hypothetical protein